MSMWKIARVAVPIAAFLAFGWMVGLIVLAVWIARWTIALARTRAALAAQTRCPRGHAVDQYGIYRCAGCGAATESTAWRCPICGALAGWTPCPTCGLAVRNPMFR